MKKAFALGLLGLVLLSSNASAHEGHNDTDALTTTSTAPAGAPVTLSAAAISNLDIKTSAAELKPLAEMLVMPAFVSLSPEKRALITTRFTGVVREIRVKVGEPVRKGQELVIVEPITAASPLITFKSPIDGVLIRQETALGQPVSAETVLMEVGDMTEVLVQGAVYETPDIARVAVGQKAKVEIGIYPGQAFEGTVEKIDAGPQTESRALFVYARLPNPGQVLRANLRGTLAVELAGGEKPVVVVPSSAVLENNGTAFLFVRNGENFERREVQLGLRAGNETVIASGVFPDEQVVTQGNYQLQYVKPELRGEKH